MGPKNFQLVLASQSPRRREILQQAGFKPLLLSPNSSESFDENLTLNENLRLIVKDKIQRTRNHISIRNKKRIIILAADTVVVSGSHVLGKPKNRPDARRMLGLLSGKTHGVITAFALYNGDQKKLITRIVKTLVGFRKLSYREIEDYLDSGEPFDKAGSYAIQGRAGIFVRSLKGDFLNVIGLPLFAVEQELRKRHWNVRPRRKNS